MANSVSLPLPAVSRAGSRAEAGTTVIPWYIWCCVIAVTSGSIGIAWDISWHKSIGRDTFWTPAHVAVYLNGVLAGVACGYLILATTFRKSSRAADATVRMWGFRGPLGAFVCAWGAVAMIASAPFDDWWHNAYGLDVKVLSPPHIVLFAGMLAIRLGTFLMILGMFNRAAQPPGKVRFLLIYCFALLLTASLGVFQEMTARIYMHSARFYLVASLIAPLWLAASSRILKARWACTIFAAAFTAIFLSFVWILPLFPAEPKLGPVYQPVTRLIPPEFPLLLLAPALALDLLRPTFSRWNRWVQSAIAGIVFLAVFIAAQWPFANFLMSPASRNWIFATQYIPFFVPPDSDYARNVFTPVEHSASQFGLRMALALAAAVLTSRLGLAWGESMQKIKR